MVFVFFDESCIGATHFQEIAMTDASAPITQDVLTIPRKDLQSDKINLVGLTRPQLRAALIEAGTPEKQAKMREGQIWHWV